ncbi:MAG: hypothetical protein RR689_03750, partial [Mucinivorans sp.]
MGCERRPLVDDIYFTAKIPIRAYWDKAALDIPASAPHDVQWSVYNATILVYNDQGTLYLEKAFTSRADYAETEITLDEGRYTLFVFNEKRDQI